MVNKLFNSSFEMELRVATLLSSDCSKVYSIERILILDFMACYAKEFGFADDETWDLSASTVLFFLPRVKRFREIIQNNHIYPGCFDDYKEWLKVLDKIILSFELMYKETETNEEISEDEEKSISEGLKLFGEYFQSLWW